MTLDWVLDSNSQQGRFCMADVIDSQLKCLPRSSAHTNEFHCRSVQHPVHGSGVGSSGCSVTVPNDIAQHTIPGRGAPSLLDQAIRKVSCTSMHQHLRMEPIGYIMLNKSKTNWRQIPLDLT
jgi:hypothetical protein